MVVYPVNVVVLVDDIGLRPVTKTIHDFSDKLLYLLLRQTLHRARIHRHMKREVLSADITPFIFLECPFDPYGVVYAVSVDQCGFTGCAFVLIILERETRRTCRLHDLQYHLRAS